MKKDYLNMIKRVNKPSILNLILFLLCFSLAPNQGFSKYAHDSEYLVLLETTYKRLSSELPKETINHLILYHNFGSAIIIKADELLVQELGDNNIAYNILTPLPANLFVATSKRGYRECLTTTMTYDSLGTVLYTHYSDKNSPIHIIKAPADKMRNLPESVKIVPLTEIRRNDHDLQRYLEYNSDVLDDDLISNIKNAVDSNNITKYITHLQEYGTRYFLHPNRREIVKWLHEKFYSFGFQEVEIDSFYIEEYNWGDFPGTWQYNIIANLPGSTYPDNYVILGGHYDSIIFSHFGDPLKIAPGADDNASGVAALLEVARILTKMDYQPHKTIKFIPFAAEEIGLQGSNHLAKKYDSLNYNIEIMINNDMIANKQIDPDWKAKIFPYDNHLYISHIAKNIYKEFTSITPKIGNINNPASDSYSFYQYDFPTVFFHEYEFSPYYHSPEDIIDNCDVEYATEITKATVLLQLYFDRIPAAITNMNIVNKGSGTEVVVSWDHPNPSDISRFQFIVRELESQRSENSRFVISEYIQDHDLTRVISGLTEGEEYLFSLSAINHLGFESVALEQRFTPQSVPQKPSNFSVKNEKDHILIYWDSNPEKDIAGYNIYRSKQPEVQPSPFIATHKDTLYVDTDLENNIYYYYAITAVDYDNNESPPTELVRAALFSLDKGILIINATPKGDGRFLNPTERQLFSFYHNTLAPFKTDYINLTADKNIDITDLVFYSTVVIFNDSIQRIERNLTEPFTTYVEGGGHLIISGFNPLSFFTESDKSNIDNYFVNEYLRIKGDFHQFGSYFSYAQPQDDFFPLIKTDTHKVPSQTESHLINIVGLIPHKDDDVVYRYGTYYQNHQPSQFMSSLPVGIMNEQTLTVSFPLFYCNYQEVKSLFNTILRNKFDEKYFDEHYDKLPGTVYLLPNYPNPFINETIIPYYIQDEGDIRIKIYNIKGQMVRDLFYGYSEKGKNIIKWDGRDENGRALTAGVYISSIKHANSNYQRKILLLR